MAGQSISKGALTLTTDAAQMQSGLARAQQSITQFGGSLKGIQNLLSFDVGLHVFDKLSGMVEGFLNGVKQAGDEAETILGLAQGFGVSAEKLQNLGGAAQLAGVETEKFNELLRVAADTAGEAAQGGEDVAKKLRAIGLATTDLAGQNGPDALNIIMDKLRGIANESDRIKAISDIFGGKKTLQVTKLLAADLGELTEKFRQMGSAFTEAQLQQMDAAADKILMLEKKWNAFRNKTVLWAADVLNPTNIADDISVLLGTNQKTIGEMKLDLHDLVKMRENLSKQGQMGDLFGIGRQSLIDREIAMRNKLHDLQMADWAAQAGAERDQQAAFAREIADAERIADVQKQARDDYFAKSQDVATLKEITAELDNIVRLSNEVITADPAEKFTQTLRGLQYQLELDKISFDTFNAGVVQANGLLMKAAGLGGDVKLPSAVVAGSAEDISSRIQSRANNQALGVNPGAQIEPMVKAQKQAMKEAADRILQSPEIKKIIDRLAPLANFNGGF